MSYFNPENYEPDKEAKKSLYASMVLLSIVFSIIIFGGLYFIFKLVEVSNYTETNGVIISSKLIKYKGSKGKVSYYPEIFYNYFIGDEKYKGHTYDYFNIKKEYILSIDTVNSNPIGKEIKVYINPKNRFETVLDKEIHPYYFSLLPILSSILFFWLMSYEMLRTGNYYMLHTKFKKTLVFAYPTAKGFAYITTGFITIIVGFVFSILDSSLKWSYFILWLFILILSYYISYLYKSNNLKFSEHTEKMIIDSEKYKNGDKAIGLMQQTISPKILFIILAGIILITLLIIKIKVF